MNRQELDAAYWSRRYQRSETGWDLGQPSAPLKEYIDSLSDKSISVLLPGAGNAYEGEYLLQKDFTEVTILDYAPEAIEAFRTRSGSDERARLLCENFFEHQGSYDLILEQTFFCALDPVLRKDYAPKMHELLKVGGRVAGLLFTEVPNAEGPPFGGSAEEYAELFRKHFIIEKLEPCYNSIKPRAGRELFFKLLKK